MSGLTSSDSHITPSGLSVTFRPIPPSQTADLRHLVLWPDKSLEDQLASYDFSEGTEHIGAFLSSSSRPISSKNIGTEYLSTSEIQTQKPIAVLTLVPSPFPHPAALPTSIRDRLSTIQSEIQLRKFAVHPSLQGQGIGTAFFQHVITRLSHSSSQVGDEEEATNRLSGDSPAEDSAVLLHLDARQHQVGFYRRLGLVVSGEPFDKYPSTSSTNPEYKASLYVRMGAIV